MKNNEFPVYVFPRRLQTFISAYLSSTNLPAKFVGVSIFMALASAIGSTYKLLYKVKYEVFASFYCVLVAQSGSGKTAPLAMAFHPIETRRRNEYLTYRKALREYNNYLKLSDEERAGRAEMEPPVYTPFIVDDHTIEKLWRILADCPRGVTIKNEEISAMFKAAGRYSGGKGTDSEFFNSFWSGEAKSVDRVSGEPLYIHPAALSIFGTIQPGVIDNMFRGGNDQNGLIPRFLFSCLPNARIIPQTKDDLDLSIFDDYTRIINKLLDIEMMVDLDGNLVSRLLRLSDEARDLYLNWYNQVFTPLATEESRSLYYEGLIKLSQYVLRFALVLQLARYATEDATNDEVVELDAMKGAILLFNYFRAELDYVNGVVNEKDPRLKMNEQQREVYNHFGGKEFIVGIGLYETLYEKYGFTKDQTKKFLQNREYFAKVRFATYRRTYFPEFFD